MDPHGSQIPKNAPSAAPRQAPRAPMVGPKPVKVDLGPAGAGLVINVSEGGVAVQSLAPLKRGAEVPLRINVPNSSNPLQASGIVAWSEPNGTAGIRFTDINENRQKELRGWLNSLTRGAVAKKTSTDTDEFSRIILQITTQKM